MNTCEQAQQNMLAAFDVRSAKAGPNDLPEATRAHLDSCGSCSELWKQLAAIEPELVHVADQSVDVPASLHQGIMQRLANEPLPVRPKAGHGWLHIAAAAAALVLVTMTAMEWHGRRPHDDSSVALNTSLPPLPDLNEQMLDGTRVFAEFGSEFAEMGRTFGATLSSPLRAGENSNISLPESRRPD